jgi:23S rRNA pseudouridine1911/1915/1917 synthase
MKLTCIATERDDGCRAVDVLIRHTGMSRHLGKKIRLYGRLEVNGQFRRMIDPVYEGERICAVYTAPGELPDTAVLQETAGIRILFQDEWLLVVEKPPHMLTHPACQGQTDALTTLLSSYNLHPVSRLDRDTSGLVVLARNGHAHHIISRSEMQKEYLGLTYGVFRPLSGSIDLPIARAADSIILREAAASGKPALTRYRTERIFGCRKQTGCIFEEDPACPPTNDGERFSLVRFALETGRTHQIRVHCQAAGHPLLGDGLYGYADQPTHPNAPAVAAALETNIGRQALHAARLSFAHPISRRVLDISSAWPADLRHLLPSLGSVFQQTHAGRQADGKQRQIDQDH